MKQIGIISDTHGYLDEAVFKFFEDCDEIWHAGDFGNISVVEKLAAFKPLKGVYGNIDGTEIRQLFPLSLRWNCEDISVMMTHIGGYPGKYATGIKKQLATTPTGLFICGHSHIVKVMFDESLNCLHINPGAAGKEGWHHIRTLVRIKIEGNRIFDCEIIELGRRASIQ